MWIATKIQKHRKEELVTYSKHSQQKLKLVLEAVATDDNKLEFLSC